MFRKFLSVASLGLILISLIGISGCESKPLEIVKASKGFDTQQQLDNHVATIRKDHMDRLIHKRDKTVYNGIRTPENSLKACIGCHVPAPTESKVVRHTDSEHFCASCHNYVSVQLDCFQCHADHPDKPEVANASLVPAMSSDIKVAVENASTEGVVQ